MNPTYQPYIYPPQKVDETPKKYIGYWRRTDEHNCFPFCKCSEYPIPCPHHEQLDQEEIIEKTICMLKNYSIEIESYFGSSPCRLCDNDENGSEEYVILFNGYQYVIPFGYFHYLRDHNVKIDDTLLKIVDHYDGYHS